MSKTKQTCRNTIVIETIFIIAICLIVLICGFLYHISYGDIIRNTVIGLFAGIAIVFSYREESINQKLISSMKYCEIVFMIIVIICLMVSSCFPLLSSTVWIFPVLITTITIYSGKVTGIIAGTYIILHTSVLSEVPTGVFFLYFIVGVFAAILFSRLEENYKIFWPITGVISILTVSLTAQILLLISGVTKLEMLLMPAMNIFLNILLYLILLKIYSITVVHKYREVYQTINDQEYEIMTMMKKDNPDNYYQAVHTAYFAERIAEFITCDRLLVKGGSYYINLSSTDNTEFPMPLKLLLNEVKSGSIQSTEAVIVYICNYVVKSVTRSIKTSKNQLTNYDELIDNAFNDILRADELKNSTIQMSQLTRIQQFFHKDKIYFDFIK